jgi:hypothetical protein
MAEFREFSFSNISFEDLDEVLRVEQVENDSKFEEWFQEKELSNSNIEFLEKLNKIYGTNRTGFFRQASEDTLKAKFITPILNEVNFVSEEFEISDFYHEKLSYKNENVKLNGFCDFYVAKGLNFPKSPLFFIQEFKRMEGSNPEPQLVAEMIAGLEVGNFSQIRGAFIVGAIWNFVILWKEDEKYFYSVSGNFDSTKLDELKAIFKNLLFVKDEIFDLVRRQI